MDAARPEGSPAIPPRAPEAPEVLQRRRFLSRVSVTLSAAAGAIVGVPVVGFLVAPLIRRAPREWRAVGRVDEFTIGTTVSVTFDDASPLPWSGVTARTAAWLRREDATNFTAFAVNCTHLGCPVRWFETAELFLCPCHGGVFNKDGSVAAGPPPKPLTRYPVRVRGGQVEIQTTPTPIA
ncbi:MAG: ubiquinol-cytochrome c reductase iron-sulfur subunit [Gemmatimonadales bacterium]